LVGNINKSHVFFPVEFQGSTERKFSIIEKVHSYTEGLNDNYTGNSIARNVGTRCWMQFRSKIIPLKNAFAACN